MPTWCSRSSKNGITVPAAAVQMGPKGPFVYAIKSNSTVAAQPVTVTEAAAGTDRQGAASGRQGRCLRPDRPLTRRRGRRKAGFARRDERG